MAAINVVLTRSQIRRWQAKLVDRLLSDGHDVRVEACSSPRINDRALDWILQLERVYARSPLCNLADRIEGVQTSACFKQPDLIINLNDCRANQWPHTPTLDVLFQGCQGLSGAADSLSRGHLPVVDLYLNGVRVDHAAPMIDSRILISRGLNDILASAVTLICKFASHFDKKIITPARTAGLPAHERNRPRGSSLVSGYVCSTLPRLVHRIVERIRYYTSHWKVGYRFIEGPGVSELGSLEGPPWQVLADPGDRFYADPFPFCWNGRYFVFVEELDHSVGKGVISVAEFGSDGKPQRPYKILEEPFHLSYPQIFTYENEIWMLPESAAGKKLTLYRARRFPDLWVEEKTIINDRELFDATLLQTDELFWLFAAERDGVGSPSDTMAVNFADRLEGPWVRHPWSPLFIDRAAARPGGRIAQIGHEFFLPVQDGTECYGGGLGLSKIVRLDQEHIALSRPVAIKCTGSWPYPRIHTINRHGPLETIDGLARIRRQR